MTNENGEVCCPMCKSTQIVANKKGFGLGKAAAGGFIARTSRIIRRNYRKRKNYCYLSKMWSQMESLI